MNTEVRCPFPYDPTTEKIAVCPYDKSHIMLAHRLGRHIFKSHKEYRRLEFPVRHETTREHHQQQEEPGGSKETKEQQEYPGGWSTEWDGEEVARLKLSDPTYPKILGENSFLSYSVCRVCNFVLYASACDQ
ncbi:uncharacterized protein LOC132698091 [Cylas formicarius]|uniref:uncharacterized protein LOC132698091 n=1 Tax=Cylas formicarius TaxID=197179 RepID=UPI002958D045|nr:uncharacterized protein LOC132698091 [Cylas formicarius]